MDGEPIDFNKLLVAGYELARTMSPLLIGLGFANVVLYVLKRSILPHDPIRHAQEPEPEPEPTPEERKARALRYLYWQHRESQRRHWLKRNRKQRQEDK